MMNGNYNRLEMENKQLKLQLANALDQIEKYKELNKKGSDAYNGLAKKLKGFCEQITSTAYAKRQVSGNSKSLSLDELLEFAIDEYNKQRKEFQTFSFKLSDTIDERDKLILKLQDEIETLMIAAQQPRYIDNEPNMGDGSFEEENPLPNDLGMPNIPLPTLNDNLDLDDDFAPVTNINQRNIPDIPNVPDIPDIPNIPIGIPPLIGNDLDFNNGNGGGKNLETKKTNGNVKKANNGEMVVQSLDEEDFEEIIPRPKNEILHKPGNASVSNNINNKKNKIENPDGGEYTKPIVSNINSKNENESEGIKQSQKDAIKLKIAKEKQEKEQKLMITDFAPLLEETKKNPIWLEIITLIGSQGISQAPKIKEIMSKNMDSEKGKGGTNINTQINAMNKANLITRENINTGYRRFLVLDLTALGTRIYEEIFGKSPVESEIRRLTRENASKEHGYLIEDSKTILMNEFGYKHVSIDRKKNTIQLKNGKKYIPDIVGSIDGKIWDYFEVERGTHTNEDFNDKLNKMYSVTRTFHFIAQNEETLTIIKEKVEKWLLSREVKPTSLTIKYTTTSHLNKRNWSDIKKY